MLCDIAVVSLCCNTRCCNSVMTCLQRSAAYAPLRGEKCCRWLKWYKDRASGARSEVFKPSATLSDPPLDRDSWRAKGQAPGAPDRPNAVAQKRSVSRASSDSVRQTRSRTQGPLSQQGLSTRFTHSSRMHASPDRPRRRYAPTSRRYVESRHQAVWECVYGCLA